LPDLLHFPDATVLVTEGEKDADRVASLGHCATTVASGKWNGVDISALAARDIFILEDHDKTGRDKALTAARMLHPTARSIRIVRLPDAKDVSEWLDRDPSRADKLVDVCIDTALWEPEPKTADEKPPAAGKAEAAPAEEQSEPIARPGKAEPAEGVSLDDFYAYMEQHNYIFAPTRALWPAGSINARLPPQPLVKANGTPVLDKKGKPVMISASAWLDRNRAVEQMAWAPGFPMVIEDRLIADGGWIKRNGVSTFNLYRPPAIEPGDKD
jgi:hypothetical protein